MLPQALLELKEKQLVALTAILVTAFSLRFFYLGHESIWLDEGYSLFFTKDGLINMLRITFLHETNPPLYYALLNGWIAIFGSSEFAIRSLSAFLGCTVVAVTFLAARQLFDQKTGLVSAFLVTISVFHIEYSQEARAYALLAFLSTASMYLFVRMWHDASVKTKLAYVICTSLLLYTHIFGWFILFAQNLYWITTLRAREGTSWRSAWWYLQFGVILAFIPWIPSLVLTSMVVQDGFWITRPTYGTLLDTLAIYSGSPAGGLLCAAVLVFAPFTKVKSEGGLFHDNAMSLELGISRPRKIYLLILWLVVPILLPFVISRVSQPIYQYKYTIGGSIAFYILLARGLNNFTGGVWLRRFVATIVFVAFLSILPNYYSEVRKEEWRTAVADIERDGREGDLVLLHSSSLAKTVYPYYRKRNDMVPTPFPNGRQTIQDLDSVTKDHLRVWLVLSHGRKVMRELLKKALAEKYGPAEFRKYLGIEVYLFGMQSTSGAADKEHPLARY